MARQVNLYIEDAEIKLLITNGKRVEKWASLPLEPGLVNDGLIVEEQQVAERLRNFFHLQRVGQSGVFVALSGLNVLFRVISMPALPKAMLPEAIRNEAARVLPVPLDQSYLAYQLLPASENETRVFLAAFPRNVTDGTIRTLAAAGLHAELIDLAPLALCRCADFPRAIIVNSWLSNVDIAILADRIPQVIRSVSLPVESPVLADKLRSIAEELDRTITFYNTGHADSPIDDSIPVLVAGELAGAPDSWPGLTGSRHNAVFAMPSPMTAPEDFNPAPFMVCIGLGLRPFPPAPDAGTSIININAVPEVYRTKTTSPATFLVPLLIIAALAGVGYGYTLLRAEMTKTTDLQTQVQQAEAAVIKDKADLASIQASVIQLQADLKPVVPLQSSLASMLVSARDSREQVSDDLKTASRLKPGNVTFTELSHDGQTLTIRGNATSSDIIFQYARDLRATNRFTTVVVSYIDLVPAPQDTNEPPTFDFALLLS